MPPTQRTSRGRKPRVEELRLHYRPPFAWQASLEFLGARAIAGVESVSLEGDGSYRRSFRIGDSVGIVEVERVSEAPTLSARFRGVSRDALASATTRLRRLFDLDADSVAVDAHLGSSPRLRRLVEATPGLRIPGAFDPWEILVRAVLGQQVSVQAARTFASRLVNAIGTANPLESLDPRDEGDALGFVFPTPAALASAPKEQLQALGLSARRVQTLQDLAHAVVEGRLDLEQRSNPDGFTATLEAFRGIGPWTSSYVALRVVGWPDSFPGGDLVLRKQLGVENAKEAAALAEAWRPWRSYAALHLWRESAGTT